MDIRIETLGGLAIRVESQNPSGLPEQPVRMALLLCLALERGITRDTLTGLLWPDQPPERARHTLSQTLYRLRQELGEDWLHSAGEHLEVSPAVTVDALEFAAAVEDGELLPALSLYRGAFLEGWGFSVTSSFEHWVDRHRLRLARLHRSARREAIGDLRARGETEEALALARRWVEIDPEEDEAHHLLIELTWACGRRAEALERYDAYRAALAVDDLEPLDETRALIQRIQDAPPPPQEVEPPRQSPPPTDGPLPKPAPEVPRRTPWLPAGLLGAAAVLIVAFFLARPLLRRAEAPPPTPNRVLVLPFEDRTGLPGMESVGSLAADWITRGLSDADFLEVRPAGEFPSRTSEPTGDVESGAEGGALALGARLGAGILVTGSVYAWGSGLELHMQIQEVPGGGILEAIGPVRTETLDPMEAIDVVRQRVAVALAIHLDQNLAPLSASALPPTYAAYQAYLEGAEKIVQGDWAGARPILEEAYHLSPTFTAPLILAAFARISTRDFHGADSLARILEEDRRNLPPYDRHRVDFLEATLAGDNAGGFRAVQSAAELLPGGSAHHASAQKALDLNRPRQALEILATFDIERPWTRTWAPYWNVLTSAHHLLGDHRKELEAARRARDRLPDRLSVLACEVRALAALGRGQEILALLTQSLALRSPEPLTPGDVMLLAATELESHGWPDEARTALERALSWRASLPPEERLSLRLRLFRARTLYLLGEMEEAKAEFAALNAEFPGEPTHLGHLGTIAARSGAAAEARAWQEELARLRRPYLFGEQTLWRARISALLGDGDSAVQLCWQAVGEGAVFGPGLLADPDLAALRDHPGFREFVAPKG